MEIETMQHTVIIDGHELNPAQANAVVQAIEDQFSLGLDEMYDNDVDENAKMDSAPYLLSLAEVLAKIDPEFSPDDIAIVEGAADFTGKLSEYGVDEVPVDDLDEIE